MKPSNLKLSTSRKPLYRLSVRQRARIISEIRRNTLSQILSEQKSNINHRDTCDVITPSVVEYNYNTCSEIYNIGDSTRNMENDGNVSSSSSFSSASPASSPSRLHITDAAPLSSNTTDREPSLLERLAKCFVENNITHTQGNNMLSVLRIHPCFVGFPKDVRTLLHTPRHRVIVSNLGAGEYIHFDLEQEIAQCLQGMSFESSINELKIDFNTDGCTLDKSGNINLWPIQCRIANISHARPIVTGIYRGLHKPNDPTAFFEKFVADVRRLICTGGVNIHGNRIPIRLRCFIADAPARAFILNHRGHTSSQPCSKCKISGIRIEGRYVFNGVIHSPRTDEEYLKCLDEDHHKEGESPLSMLPIGLVSQVPFEYMHLICLGVMKKLLTAWIHGKYSRLSKLSGRSISVICARLNILKEYCPSDFVRRPRSIDVCCKYKATEFRQFLLYTGLVVMYGVLDEMIYKHFLFLCTSIRILVSKSPSTVQLNFAELALKKFVERSVSLYGPTFNTYNVHGLLHVTDDVRHLGSLDSFSAFPYENNMSLFRKYCRKPGLPLQQFFNRITELEQCGIGRNVVNCNSSIRVFAPRNNSLNCRQYRQIQFHGILLSVHVRDNCCILNDRSICIVSDIVVDNDSYQLVVKRFLLVEDFYDIGMLSSAVGVYKCSMLSRDVFYIHPSAVAAKCYRMPFSDSSSTNDNDTDNHSEPSSYIIAAIIHTEKIVRWIGQSVLLQNLLDTTSSSDEALGCTYQAANDIDIATGINKDIDDFRRIMENRDHTADLDNINTNNSEPNFYSYPQLPNPNCPQHISSAKHNIPHASFQQSCVPTTQYTLLDTFSTTQASTVSQAHTHTFTSNNAEGNNNMINTLPKSQTNLSTCYVVNNNAMERQVKEPYVGHVDILKSIETTVNRIVQESFDPVKTELKRMNGLLESILRNVRPTTRDNSRMPRKPANLPVSSLEEMDSFENIDDGGYSEVVNYFEHVGGFTLKEAVNLCFKEAMKDSLTQSFTWWGREGAQKRALYNCRLIIAIYDAVCGSRYFNKPTRAEFQACMREALRTAKERCRSKTRDTRDVHRQAQQTRMRNFWSDQQDDPRDNETD